jgi:uncharacterized protein (TIGR03083 family)
MDPDRYLALLRADGDRLAEVAAPGLDPPVPSCPGWTVRDVVAHMAEVYQHKLACIREGRRPDPWPPEEFASREPLAFFRESLDELIDEMKSRGPQAPAYTWWKPDQTVGFWYRRMAQETAVHRVDVELGHNLVTPIDDELALDGVDEVLERFLAAEDWADQPVDAAAGTTVTVRAGDHAWRVHLEREEVAIEPGPGHAEATVTGEPSELLLWLWGRRPDSAVHIEGDTEVVHALRERLALATQ